MLLQSINSPEDLKNIPEEKLPQLAKEIRTKIIEVVGKNGGHLASNLGVVELTIELHRVFNSPQDAIIWDVSHQSYTHKLLTGRYSDFSSIRTKDGISGFTRINESEHDFFDAGHASSSISSALGLLTAWKETGRNDKVVAVIGDGALTGGMAFEGLSHAGQLGKNLIVIVNDNQMSIGPNVGALSRYLSRLSMTGAYQSLRRRIDRAIDLIPRGGKHIGKFIYRLKRGLKGLILSNNLFVDLGFEYVGPLNGHNMSQLDMVLRRVKNINRPVVIHVVTKKGKGYSPAENDPSTFHGIGPFNTSDGFVEKYDNLSFTEAFSEKMLELGEKNEKVCAITAAMAKGTGLDAFSRRFRNRFFDVGIAEEHAVTFAGGLAAGGMIPVTAIYSTFIQRSVDQIIEDVAMQHRHVVIVLDRSGAVPGDGETHQGIFDITLLKCIPGIKILSPVSQKDISRSLEWAVMKENGPVVIRWPKAACPSELKTFDSEIEEGRGLFISHEEYAPSISVRFTPSQKKKAPKLLIVCTGGMFSECLTASRSLLLSGILADIYTLRFIKPFDESYFTELASGYEGIVFVEDGLREGGMAVYCRDMLNLRKATQGIKTAVLAFPDKFVSNGNRNQILSECGLDSAHIEEAALRLISKKKNSEGRSGVLKKNSASVSVKEASEKKTAVKKNENNKSSVKKTSAKKTAVKKSAAGKTGKEK